MRDKILTRAFWFLSGIIVGAVGTHLLEAHMLGVF